MATPMRMALSRLVGWAADRKVPTPLRAPIYRSYARMFRADLSEARPPLSAYPSLGAFFVRRLVDGARPLCPEHELPSPVDGTVQAIGTVHDGSILQAKGRPYELRQLLGDLGREVELEGGTAWTIYLSPRDYHRIHSPAAAQLRATRWIQGARYSVQPAVLARRMVLPINERVVLELETPMGPLFLVLVGALNVGRIRVLGVQPGHPGPLEPALPFARGEELARFEMGSTIVLIAPPGGWKPLAGLTQGATVKLGQAIGSRGA